MPGDLPGATDFACDGVGCDDPSPRRAATAYWSVPDQEWVLCEDMEAPYCAGCDGDVEEVPVCEALAI